MGLGKMLLPDMLWLARIPFDLVAALVGGIRTEK
jgi:hypothetical protein